jgi:hypothetical protein
MESLPVLFSGKAKHPNLWFHKTNEWSLRVPFLRKHHCLIYSSGRITRVSSIVNENREAQRGEICPAVNKPLWVGVNAIYVKDPRL